MKKPCAPCAGVDLMDKEMNGYDRPEMTRTETNRRGADGRILVGTALLDCVSKGPAVRLLQTLTVAW